MSIAASVEMRAIRVSDKIPDMIVTTTHLHSDCEASDLADLIARLIDVPYSIILTQDELHTTIQTIPLEVTWSWEGDTRGLWTRFLSTFARGNLNSPVISRSEWESLGALSDGRPSDRYYYQRLARSMGSLRAPFALDLAVRL